MQCTVRYAGRVHVNFYHGFTQPGRLDRQEFRLLFEHGEVTLEEWVPVRLRIRAAVNEEQTRSMMEIFPGAQMDVLKSYGGRDRAARGRHKDVDIAQEIELRYGLVGREDAAAIANWLRALFADSMAWSLEPITRTFRKITERNGRDSLAMAVEATRLALRG